MAEIRCPMCGKPNPEKLEICQFCQARLKPLISSTPEEEPLIPDQTGPDSELPDWLDFDSGADFSGTDDDTPFEDEGETDDWMTRLGDGTGFEENSQPQDEPDSETDRQAASRMDFNNNGIPDWLEDMEAKRETPSMAASQESNDAELPSWLSGEEVEPLKTLEESSDLPDWLSDFGAQDDNAQLDEVTPDGSASSIHPFAEEEGDLPDWLTSGSDTEPSVPATSEGRLPDWLSDTSVEAEELSGADADLPDWLSDVEASSTAPVDEGLPASRAGVTDLPKGLLDGVEGEEELSTAEESEMPEWLSDRETGDAALFDDQSLPNGTENIDGVEKLLTTQAGELPDWLSDMEAGDDAIDEDQPPSTGMEDADMPDWLAELSEQEEGQVAEVPKAPKPFDLDTGDLASWLADDTDAAEKSSEVEKELPDPLSDFDQQVPPISDIQPQDALLPDFSTAEGSDLPEWLLDSEDSESAIPTTTDDEIPDWLSRENSGDEAEGMLTSTDQDENLPDWLVENDEHEETQTEEVDRGLEKDISLHAEDGLPDWLRDSSVEDAIESVNLSIDQDDDQPDQSKIEEAGAIALGLGLAKAIGEDEEVPDWLADIDGVDPLTSEDEESTLVDQDEVPAWLADVVGEEIESGAETEEKLPDWLPDIDGIDPVEEVLDGEPDLSQTIVDESRAVPDWLRGSEEPLSQSDEETDAEPISSTPFDTEDDFDDDLFEMEELADWISDEVQTDLDSMPEQTDPIDGLEPAELPGWLAAMRPIESSASDTDSVETRGLMENAGPLAGLYGVLAAEPEISRLKKPPVYSSKLHITDAQQTHASVLQEILEAEEQSQPLPLPPKISSQRIFRIVLSVVLVMIAFLAVLTGGEISTMPAPGNIPIGVEQTRNLVNALTQEDAVLLAFDYEPGLVGEMDAVSAAVVDHMMLKGTKLVLVSTSPTGPVLAERFVSEVQGRHGYISGIQYVNLGYVPGGVTGLGAFARNPRWVSPDTLNGELAWGTEPLKNITKISEFSMVALITDNPNTARAWIEQVNPELDAVPLIALVSAQAEPMVRPYFDTQQTQLDGLVSGLTGGAAYEVMTRSNLARTYWDAFNIVLIVAVSTILIGGGITVISNLLAQRKESKGEIT